MAYEALAAGIGSVGGIVGSIANTYMDYKYNQHLLSQEYDLAQKNWLQQQEYNNPMNSYGRQMEAMKEYGLNPYLMYGNGTVAQTGNASAPPHTPNATGMKLRGVDFYSATQLALQAKQVEADVNLKNANADYIRGAKTGQTQSQTGLLDSQTIETNTRASLNRMNEVQQRELFGIQKESLEVSLQNLKHTGNNLVLDALNKVKTGEQIDANTANIIQRTSNLVKEYDLLDARIKEAEGHVKLMQSQAGLADAQAGLADAQKSLVEQQTRYAKVKADLFQLGITENDFYAIRVAGLAIESVVGSGYGDQVVQHPVYQAGFEAQGTQAFK